MITVNFEKMDSGRWRVVETRDRTVVDSITVKDSAVFHMTQALVDAGYIETDERRNTDYPNDPIYLSFTKV